MYDFSSFLFQVLTFNLTNAFILMLLKGLLIGAGILGKISLWKFPFLGGFAPIGRSLNLNNIDTDSEIFESWFSNEDFRWASAYMWAINKEDFGCLYRLACENPESAKGYLYGGKLLRKMFKATSW